VKKRYRTADFRISIIDKAKLPPCLNAMRRELMRGEEVEHFK
jgi:hypothetical protein